MSVGLAPCFVSQSKTTCRPTGTSPTHALGQVPHHARTRAGLFVAARWPFLVIGAFDPSGRTGKTMKPSRASDIAASAHVTEDAPGRCVGGILCSIELSIGF